MTDDNKHEKAAETSKPAKAEKVETPEVASEHVVGDDIYYEGVDGSRWVVRGANK